MIYYTKYAGQKFDVLRAHKFSLTKEDVEKVLKVPEVTKKFDDQLWLAQGEYSDEYNLRVIFEPEGEMQKVITFYPVKK
jgi:hypothetical protein